MCVVTLNDRILAALQEHAAENGGGIVTGFVCAVGFINSDGDHTAGFATLDEQATPMSLGLVEYAHEWFLDDARQAIQAAYVCECDEDD